MVPSSRQSQNLGQIIEYIPGERTILPYLPPFLLALTICGDCWWWPVRLTTLLSPQIGCTWPPTRSRPRARRCSPTRRRRCRRGSEEAATRRRRRRRRRAGCRRATSPSTTHCCITPSTTTLGRCTSGTCTGLPSSSTRSWAPRRIRTG